MSRWTERFETHPVSSGLSAFDDLVQRCREKAIDDPEALQTVERINQVLALLKARLDAADPTLVPKSLLDHLETRATVIRTGFEGYLAEGGSQSHLDTADSAGDELLLQVSQLIRVSRAEDVEAIRESVSGLRRSVGQHLSNLNDEAGESFQKLTQLQQGVDELAKVVESQKARLDTAIAEFQKQFSEEQSSRNATFLDSESKRATAHTQAAEARAAEVAQVISDSKARFDALFKQQQDSEAKRNEEYRQASETRDKEVSKLIEDAAAKLDTLLASQEQLYGEYFDGLKHYKKRAEDLVHVIGNTGMVGGFQRVANQARAAAVFWRVIALLFLILLIVTGFYMFVIQLEQVDTIEHLLARAFVTTSFAVVAGYAARQGGRNSKVERYNRKMELELASIDPYIVGLPEETQHRLKELFADRAFGQKLGGDDLEDPNSDTVESPLSQALTALIEVVKRLR